MIYKNISRTTKTFYGKTFKPGDEIEVPGYINRPGFVRLNEFSKEPPKTSSAKVGRPKSKEKTDKESDESKDNSNK